MVAASVLAALLAWGGWTLLGPGSTAPRGPSTIVIIPSGGGLAGVARTLAKAGVVRSRAAFIAAAVLTGAGPGLKAGEYDVPSRASLFRILGALRRGAVVRHFITIPEGLTSAAAREVVAKATFLSGPTPMATEGSLLPETYQASRGESRAAVIGRMTAARDRLLAELWRSRAPGLPYRSPEQAVILASVVEKETARAEERPRIAAVFINRLKRGMRLESDPTVIYGLSGGVPLGHGLRASELASASLYNTYRVAGLPPTPIANPGRAALKAALDPARTEDLFFVADGGGGHVFAATFEDHKRHVARWRAVEHQRKAGGGT